MRWMITLCLVGLFTWGQAAPMGLSAPELMTPEDGAENLPTNQNFRWGSVVGATFYEINFSESPVFQGAVQTFESESGSISLPLDSLLNNTVYYWRVRALNDAEVSDWSPTWQFSTMGVTTANEADGPIPNTALLAPSFPNPFSSETQLVYVLSAPTTVSLAVYSMIGKQVAMLVSGQQKAGKHEVNWQGKGLPNGVYFVQLRTPQTQRTRTLVLQR